MFSLSTPDQYKNLLQQYGTKQNPNKQNISLLDLLTPIKLSVIHELKRIFTAYTRPYIASIDSQFVFLRFLELICYQMPVFGNFQCTHSYLFLSASCFIYTTIICHFLSFFVIFKLFSFNPYFLHPINFFHLILNLCIALTNFRPFLISLLYPNLSNCFLPKINQIATLQLFSFIDFLNKTLTFQIPNLTLIT